MSKVEVAKWLGKREKDRRRGDAMRTSAGSSQATGGSTKEKDRRRGSSETRVRNQETPGTGPVSIRDETRDVAASSFR